jgi:hypothetical protein
MTKVVRGSGEAFHGLEEFALIRLSLTSFGRKAWGDDHGCETAYGVRIHRHVISFKVDCRVKLRFSINGQPLTITMVD